MDEVTRLIFGLDQVIQLLDFDLRYHEKLGFIKLLISFLTVGVEGSWLRLQPSK